MTCVPFRKDAARFRRRSCLAAAMIQPNRFPFPGRWRSDTRHGRAPGIRFQRHAVRRAPNNSRRRRIVPRRGGRRVGRRPPAPRRPRCFSGRRTRCRVVPIGISRTSTRSNRSRQRAPTKFPMRPLFPLPSRRWNRTGWAVAGVRASYLEAPIRSRRDRVRLAQFRRNSRLAKYAACRSNRPITRLLACRRWSSTIPARDHTSRAPRQRRDDVRKMMGGP